MKFNFLPRRVSLGTRRNSMHRRVPLILHYLEPGDDLEETRRARRPVPIHLYNPNSETAPNKYAAIPTI
jgi:hypothetical protein